MLIDKIAERYGCLPSEVLSRGDSFDIFVIETMWSYEQYRDDKEKMRNGQVTPTNVHVLKEMMEKTKGAGNGN